jgi:alkylhydroperoxidase family enzyme
MMFATRIQKMRYEMKAFRVSAVLLLMGASFVAGRVIAQETPNASRINAMAKETGLPKDVFPDQLARVPMAKRDQLIDSDKKIYDGFESQDYAKEVGIWSPGGLLFNAPGLSTLDTATNQYLRKSAFGGAEYELATLVAAREMNCQVVWTAHEPQALKRGVSKEAVDVVKYRKPAGSLGEKEAAIVQFGREIFEKDLVSSETYAHTEKLFGRDGVLILTAIIGYRTGTAQVVRVFDQRLNPNLKPLLPIP